MPHASDRVERAEAVTRSMCERFLLPAKVDYCQQYLHAYTARLDACSRRLRQAALLRWGSDTPVKKLIEVKTGERCAVIGTVFKQQELKKSILKSLSDDLNVLPQPVGYSKIASDTDVVYIEEEHQKCKLTSAQDLSTLVTGIPIAVLGEEQHDGHFEVEDVAFMATTFPSVLDRQEWTCDKYILLMSGLSFGAGEREAASARRAQLLLDWLAGLAHAPERAACVARLAILGNLISDKASDKSYSSKAKYLTRKTYSDSVDATRAVDAFLAQVTSQLHVDILPGPSDMTNYVLPQQPLHRCMFPACRDRSSALSSYTNPALYQADGVMILATSGRVVEDVRAHSTLETSLEAMESLLRWGHMAPTAPDTLGMYPYLNRDPFVLEELPHVFVAGNCCEQLGWKEIEHENGSKTLLISVPSFAETGECALLNLRDLSVDVLSFSTYS